MCDYCGETDGCKFTSGLMSQVDTLNVDDWRRIYGFVKYVQLPFLHRIILQSQERKTGVQHIPVPRQRAGTAGEDIGA
jgi:hypothetical protein